MHLACRLLPYAPAKAKGGSTQEARGAPPDVVMTAVATQFCELGSMPLVTGSLNACIRATRSAVLRGALHTATQQHTHSDTRTQRDTCTHMHTETQRQPCVHLLEFNVRSTRLKRCHRWEGGERHVIRSNAFRKRDHHHVLVAMQTFPTHTESWIVNGSTWYF